MSETTLPAQPHNAPDTGRVDDVRHIVAHASWELFGATLVLNLETEPSTISSASTGSR